MKNKMLYLWVIASLLMGCSKELHETSILPPGDSKSVITVAFNTHEVPDKPLNDVHLYFFNEADALTSLSYYPSMTHLALDKILLESGHYTVFAIFNTEEGLAPVVRDKVPNISFPDFRVWVKTLDAQYEHLLTGMVRHEANVGFSQVTIDVKAGSDAAEVSTVALYLTYPQPLLPYDVATRASLYGENVRLRVVVELFDKGTDQRVLRATKFVEPIPTEGVYFTSIVMPRGEFDVRIWSDYAESELADYHYNTESLKNIKILPRETYWANTDTRDGFGHAATIQVGKEDKAEEYTLHRPLAKYKIVASDVQEYDAIRAKRGYPPIEDLQIKVIYTPFLPAGYNVVDGTLTASSEGYSYLSRAAENDGLQATVAKDFVLVNGQESSVVVNVLFKDSQGNTVSGVNGVRIYYKLGHLTTISGKFLTAGKGGIDIDTSWDDDFDIEF